MKKILWLDTETTGTDRMASVIQVAGVIEVEGVVEGEFNVLSRPFSGATISDVALEINHRTREEIAKLQDPVFAIAEFGHHLGQHVDKFNREDKFILAGHNVGFDLDKMIRYYEEAGNKYLGSWLHFKQQFDTLAVYRALAVVDRVPVLEDNRLATMAKQLGVELTDVHDALADIRATRTAGLKLMAMLRGGAA